MNTVGPDHSCVLLNDNRCTAYEGRPQTCRLYPFSAHTGSNGKAFEFLQCVDQHAAHFSEGRLLVNDWLRENFSKADREFLSAEGASLLVLGNLLRKLGPDGVRANMFYILHYRYYNYNLDKPFMAQYTSNMSALILLLQRELGEV